MSTITTAALTLVLAICASVGPGPASAQSAPPQATVSFPAGWRVVDKGDGLVSARQPGDRARCNRDLTRLPHYDATPQAELNAELTRPWGEAEWASFLGAPVDKVEVVGTGWDEDGPRVFRKATLLIRRGATPVTRKDVYAFIGVELVPGWAVIAACYAPVGDYPAMREAMEATVQSLRVR